MVKKVRLVEDETTSEELDQADYQAKMLEYQQAIDWKLWEMLKIAQAWAIKEGVIETDPPAGRKTKTEKPLDNDIKPVIIDDDIEDETD